MARGLQKNFLGSAPGNLAYAQERVARSRIAEQERREARENNQLDKICEALKSRGVTSDAPVQNITININVTPDQVSAITPERLSSLIEIAKERAKDLSN